MRLPADLTPHTDCDDPQLGLAPLAIGWLHRRARFETGRVPKSFAARLRPYCHPSQTVNQAPQARPCPLCNQRILLDENLLGAAEIRVLGEDDIFAAPDLVYHYVTVHGYQPPQIFVDAVLNGYAPDSAAHRALINTLQQL